MHSDCDNCEKEDSRYAPTQGRTTKKHVCFEFTGESKDVGEFSYKMSCHYMMPEVLTCTTPSSSGNIPGMAI